MTITNHPRARGKRVAALVTSSALAFGGLALASPAMAADRVDASMALAVTADPANFKVGEPVQFTATMTNDGKYDLDVMGVTFPAGLDAGSCTELTGASLEWDTTTQGEARATYKGKIAPDAQAVCTGTWVPTQADYDAGKIEKVFWGMPGSSAINDQGLPVKSPLPVRTFVTLEAAPLVPTIDISKNAEGDDSHNVDPGQHEVTVRIVNNGDEPLTDFVFTDTTESGNDVVWSQTDLDTLAGLTLDPGNDFVVHGTVLVEESTHRDSATVDATGTISGQPVKDEDPTELVPNEPEPEPTPEIDIRKNAEGDDSQVVKPGEHPVTVTITNTGEESLTNFTFQDTTESGNDVVWSEEDLKLLEDLILLPGEYYTVNGTVLVEADTHRDEVLVDATGVISGKPVNDDDPTELVPEEPVTPEIDIRKNAEGDDSYKVEAGKHPVTVTIVNTGEEALTEFTFKDTTESGNDVVWNEDDLSALDALTLEPGDEFVVRGEVLVETATHRDEVVVDANGVISGKPVTDDDPTELVPEKPVTPVEPTPEIDISKNDEGDDKHVVKAGEHEVTVTIVNTGEEDLTSFTFTDTTESGNDVTWSDEDLKALTDLTLAPGDKFVVHGTVLVEDGSHRDNVVIDASGVISGKPVADEDPTELVPEEKPKPEEPSIDVSKNAEGDDSQTVKAGKHEVIVTIVNNGTEPLSSFTFDDTTESGNDVTWSVEDLETLAYLTLQPGEKFVVHGTVLVEEDTHRDEVTINASGVISGLPVGDEDPTEFVPEKPAVEVPVKESPKPEALATTGGEIAPWLIGGAAATVLAGGILLILSRRRADVHQD